MVVRFVGKIFIMILIACVTCLSYFSLLYFLRKLFTGVASAGALIQGVFFAEYNIEGMEGKDHVFTHIRSDARQWIDSTIYGYNKHADDTTNKKKKKQKKKDDIATNGGDTAA